MRYPQHIRCENNRVWLPKIGWVKYRNSRAIPGTIKQAIVYKRGKRWHISIVFEEQVDIVKVPIREEEALGVDVGIKVFAALSTGEKVDNPAYLHQLLKRECAISIGLNSKRKSLVITGRSVLLRYSNYIAASRT